MHHCTNKADIELFYRLSIYNSAYGVGRQVTNRFPFVTYVIVQRPVRIHRDHKSPYSQYTRIWFILQPNKIHWGQ